MNHKTTSKRKEAPVNATSTKELQSIATNVGTALYRALFEEITHLRTPWVVTPQQQQQDVLDRMRAAVDHAVAHAVRQIATGQFLNVAVEIESLTIKDDAKAVLVMPRGTEEIHPLMDHVKSKAVLVFADPADYAAHASDIKSQADQPPLPFDD